MKLLSLKNRTWLILFFASTVLFTACKKDDDMEMPNANALDPKEAAANDVLTLTGSGLSNIQSIVFDKGMVPAAFNPNFNTDKAVIFRVPDTAYGGPQNIIFTKTNGQTFSVGFSVIALATISDVSNYNFTSGGNVTITGNNLDDVSKVVLTGTQTEATIVSKTKKELVVSFPQTDMSRATLDITNASGTVTTTQEFVNMDKALVIFADDYMNGFQNASWGPAAVSTTVAKSGTSSFAATYNKGNWSADGFANWYPGLDYAADYKFLTFWVKGGSIDYTLYVTGDQRAGGYGNADQSAPVIVPANVWTYFKIPLSTLDLWNKGSNFKQLGFWIKGPDAQDETFYFDDVMLVK